LLNGANKDAFRLGFMAKSRAEKSIRRASPVSMKEMSRHCVAIRNPATRSRGALVLLLTAFGFFITPNAVRAQQLEPRAYSPAPIGLNFLGLGSLYSSGGVVTDPSIPIQNIDAEVTSVVPYYARTFGLFGRLASVTAVFPYAWATVRGDVNAVSNSVDRAGLLDPQFRFAINLLGGPALSPKEFSQREPQATLGASLSVVAPLGQYDPAKLINLGTNRWAYKPELGFSQPAGKWIFEVYAGVWLFQTNDNFFGGQVREQHSLASYQAHVVYTFRQNLWAAVDYTYYSGGSTVVDGRAMNDRQGNSRGGMTVSLPVSKEQTVKLSWAQGVSTRIGSSFETFSLTWQYFWL
jgi:hypothetical protein